MDDLSTPATTAKVRKTGLKALRTPEAVVVMAAGLTVLLSTGIRQSFGIFLPPVSEALGSGREVYSLAIALQNLLFGLPLLGVVADRIGARRVVVLGGFLYAAGLVLVARVDSPAGLYLTLGGLVGLALSATTYVVVLGAVAQVVPRARRSRAFGLVTAAGSLGMFALPPIAQLMLSNLGWQTSLLLLGVASAALMLLALALPQRGSSATPEAGATQEEPFISVLQKARGHSGFWLLTAGFFVCGFHVAFIATHLPAYLGDNRISPLIAAGALGLIGMANIFGSYSFGLLGDRFRKKYLLSALYLGRAVVIALFLLIPLSNASALVFGAVIGFLWLATVPLTSGTVAQIFGARYLSTLYGVVFLSHQIGSFLGVWLAGRIYDSSGSYLPVWYVAIVLGIIAAIIHTPISDQPVTQMELSPS